MKTSSKLFLRRPWGWLVLVALVDLLGCGKPAESPAAGQGASQQVASYRGGEVSLRETEQLLRREGGVELGKGGVESLLTAYRNAAESVVVDRLLLGDETTEEVLAELGEKGQEIRRQVMATVYLSSRLGDLQVRPEEVEAYYVEHRSLFHREAQRDLWHLYRRHRDPAHPEETTELLRELKRRAEAGEGFSQLALQYSDSETRGRGGRLGQIRSGRLPKALEEKVFALPAGAVSEPLAVAGGGALFYVSEVLEARDFPLEDVRPEIVAHLSQSKRRARIAELVAGREPPPGSTVLELDRLVETLAGADAGVVVLAVGDYRLTAGELRRRLEPEKIAADPLIEPDPRERLRLIYQDLLHEQLLLLAASEAEMSELQRRTVEERIGQLARQELAQQRLEIRMRQRMEDDEPALRRFYDDNRHLYQTPLRLKLKSMNVAAGREAARTQAVLEQSRSELASGAIDFSAAAARVGATVEDVGWIDFDTLMSYEPKVRYYVLELGGTGYTVPFQLNRRLSMVWVEAREEPREQPFETVRESVADDYYDRHQQQLYRATVDALLAGEQFRFFEDNVRRVLTPATPAPAGGTSAGG